MKKVFCLMVLVAFCLAATGAARLYAEETTTPETTTLKQELEADKQKIKEQKDEMKANAQAAHTEEKALKGQIKEARKAGDTEKVKELRSQLKTTHQENVKQMKQDKKELHGAKKELWKDRKAAHTTRR